MVAVAPIEDRREQRGAVALALVLGRDREALEVPVGLVRMVLV